ncbi:MAG: 3-phosphoshikimate 1-carboxyvinyltransferase [Acidobacteria bacterium]|nr:MAG: 3-phosphoshikimate 1-carboxyvinyltransferase [Acidobacteriota bacterium]
MRDFLAFPPARSVRGTIHAPPSKSATNRALVLAALSSEEVELVRPLDSDDTRALARCLEAMGAVVRPTAAGLAVKGPLGRQGTTEEVVLDAEASGTAARFLAPLACAFPGRYVLTGSPRLRERPMSELLAALRVLGADVEERGAEGFLPLSIRGGNLRRASIEVDASRSSQFLSALLLAAVAVDGGLSVRPSGRVVSAPYAETTLAILREFGHSVRRGASGEIRVERGSASPGSWEVPGDWSSSLPFFAAAGICGGDVSVIGLSWPSPDADALALDAIESMGVEAERETGAIRARAHPRSLRPVSIDAADFPDAVPVLTALAAFAEGESRFAGIGHLRVKESDRIAALAALAQAAGATALDRPGELSIAGPPRPAAAPARLPTFEDHRLAMAAALLSLGVPGALIENPDCVAKSYPGFFRDLETILVRG